MRSPSARAQYKGQGVIKGQAGTVNFILTAIDGQMPGGGATDKFRLKDCPGRRRCLRQPDGSGRRVRSFDRARWRQHRDSHQAVVQGLCW